MNRFLALLLLVTFAIAAPARAAGGLSVQSKPAGATVFLDGAPAGVTPLVLEGVAPGTVSVVVGAPGYGLFSKQVRVREGKTAKVKAKLKKAKPLLPERKAGARAALTQNATLSAEWKSLIRLATGLVGDFQFGGFWPLERGPGAAAFETEAGYYVDISYTGGGGGLQITVDFYLDEALTQLAGQMTLTTDLLTLEADYSFTDGRYAGSTGHLDGAAGLFGLDAVGSGNFSDGTAWTADLTVSLTDDELAFAGALDLTYPDATTAHWDIEGSITGSDVLITTSSGYVLDLHLNPDGSGGGTIIGPDSAVPLAAISWDAGGAGIIVYADGTIETFHLYL